MWDYDIDYAINEVELAMIKTHDKVGTWQVEILKTILKTLLTILQYIRWKEHEGKNEE